MGADVDSWSVERLPKPGYPTVCMPGHKTLRTPLMVAASKGYLPIVKLLFNPPCGADHALCAPDGQTALRLAADKGHRGVVDFLPHLRKGGCTRIKYQHTISMYNIGVLTRTARWGLVWRLPKALVYDIPKWSAKELWRRVKHFVTEVIPRMGRYLIYEFPIVVARLTAHLPRAIGTFFWKVITIHLPHTMTETAEKQLLYIYPRFLAWGLKVFTTVWPQRFAIGSWNLFTTGNLATASVFTASSKQP